MGRLYGKRALVTGAARGIGQAIASAFAREGAQVLAADIDAAGLGSGSSEPGVSAIAADVTRREDVERLRDAAGQLDVLVNCAGWVHSGDLLACSPEDWHRSFEVNVTSIYNLSRALIPSMLGRRSAIVNIASVVSSMRGVPGRAAYGASKGAVIGLTKAIAADYADRGLRCNAICPGTVDTPSLGDRAAATGDEKAARAAFAARQPIGRIGRPTEIASAAVYLASDESSFVTGSLLVVDGGMAL